MCDAFGVLVRADAVDGSSQQQVLRVGAVAGEEDGVVAVFDQDADMAWAVAWERNERDVACPRQAQALREGPERFRLQTRAGSGRTRRASACSG